MSEFLCELFTEEIPARMQRRAASDFQRILEDRLAAARIEATGIETFVTPRRIALVIRELADAQPDLTEERRGPRVGAPEKALEGFLRSTGLTLDECEKRETPKGEFYFAVMEKAGQPTVEVLPELLAGAILELPWPKSMRWGDHALRFVRPLHGILALFAGQTLPGGLFLGDPGSGEEPGYRSPASESHFVAYRAVTWGHRFHAPDEFEVSGFDDYRAKLKAAKVLIDSEERMDLIASRAGELAAAHGLTVADDPGLREEVAGLVEWPVVLMGAIDPEFMEVPPEVLTTAMRTHLKYFSLLDGEGALAPHFIVVANMEAADGGTQITEGNERVLRARLADAKFFWDQDRKRRLADRVTRLEPIIFQARLGTLLQKVARVRGLAYWLAEEFVPDAEPRASERAAHLCKTDLTTDMVGEFPELQGIMGRYYALHDGERAVVADAISEHYSPLGPGDRCPRAPVSVVVSLADKIDSLVGFFAIDEKPTGSKDPYALRRAALGAIRLIVENQLRVPLRRVYQNAWERYPDDVRGEEESIFGDLLEFFADRLKVHLREQGVRHDLISAIFARGGEDDLVRLLARVDALREFLESDDGANLLTAYRRASNIVRIEEKKDETSYDGSASVDLLQQPEEKALYEALGEVHEHSGPALRAERFTEAMGILARLRPPVDAFFDEVTVNCDEAPLRKNRLLLLSQIRAALESVADFSKIEG